MQTNFPEIGLELFLLFAMAPLSEGFTCLIRDAQWTRPFEHTIPQSQDLPMGDFSFVRDVNCEPGCTTDVHLAPRAPRSIPREAAAEPATGG